ncbi:hypothetical protein [Candidatus Phytoplasma melaleucae]|uniref:Uncharacterized protein n=1 Tax=Candidatus Phytoplasma melaleucae TaxID=2982630 RepID=A0ABT9DFF5_9MOLU|nr:hypothetical protein ['Melaleuca sp.' phytoplasma]MDO8168146.1 hypothetical protein ['Melaleuca sp.' phytoplasma]MDV3205226.1 hypothetical protein [Weeping tea tree witches'-broom phytoplasma]
MQKKNLLNKIFMISVFVSMTIFMDFFSNILMPFLKMPLGGQFFKISFIILFLSGFLEGFLVGFIVCLCYAFYHLCKGYLSLLGMHETLQLNISSLMISCIFDYVLPDLFISVSGFFHNKKMTHITNKKNILASTIIISFFRMIFFLISSYYVYSKHIISAFPVLFARLPFEWCLNSKLFFLCFCYCFLPCFVNCVIGIIFLIFILPKISYIMDKYL